jgi:hypothetical protein
MWPAASTAGRRSVWLKQRCFITRPSSAVQARTLPSQKTEAKIGCNVLNRMARLGMPALRPGRLIRKMGQETPPAAGSCTDAGPNQTLASIPPTSPQAARYATGRIVLFMIPQ